MTKALFELIQVRVKLQKILILLWLLLLAIGFNCVSRYLKAFPLSSWPYVHITVARLDQIPCLFFNKLHCGSLPKVPFDEA
jgi:hypothetical protein